MDRNEGEVTQVLEALGRAERQAIVEALPLVDDELRRQAAKQLGREMAGQTLRATALVRVAYLRLVGGDPDRLWNGRAPFLATASRAMLRIHVEAARRTTCEKRGSEHHRIQPVDPSAPDPNDDLLALNDVLNRLAKDDPVAANVVELHQFAGTRHEEPSTAVGISVYFARPKWTYASAWGLDAMDN
jgi:RNA polymerase sigma factor (TIGR02999 family)